MFLKFFSLMILPFLLYSQSALSAQDCEYLSATSAHGMDYEDKIKSDPEVACSHHEENFTAPVTESMVRSGGFVNYNSPELIGACRDLVQSTISRLRSLGSERCLGGLAEVETTVGRELGTGRHGSDFLCPTNYFSRSEEIRVVGSYYCRRGVKLNSEQQTAFSNVCSLLRPTISLDSGANIDRNPSGDVRATGNIDVETSAGVTNLISEQGLRNSLDPKVQYGGSCNNAVKARYRAARSLDDESSALRNRIAAHASAIAAFNSEMGDTVTRNQNTSDLIRVNETSKLLAVSRSNKNRASRLNEHSASLRAELSELENRKEALSVWPDSCEVKYFRNGMRNEADYCVCRGSSCRASYDSPSPNTQNGAGSIAPATADSIQ